MAKMGRPKQVKETALLELDNLPDSWKPVIDARRYQYKQTMDSLERLEKVLKQFYEIAGKGRLPDTKAKALAKKLGESI